MPSFRGLHRNVADVGVVAGDKDDVGLAAANRGELGGEILVAIGVGLLGRDLAAHFGERLVEFVLQADGIGGRLVVEDRRLVGL